MRKLLFLFLLIRAVGHAQTGSPFDEVAPSGSMVYTDLKTAVKESSTCYRMELRGPVQGNVKLFYKIPTLTNLMALRLSENGFEHLAPGFNYLPNLVYFSSEKNPLLNLSDSFALLGQLRFVDLYQTAFDSFPNGLVWAPRLQSLRMVSNLPKDTFHFSNNIASLAPTLERLAIDSTRIDSLTPTLGQLTNLKHLSLTNCSLTSIPTNIGKLKNLETLMLDNNQLKTLPKEIRYLKSLKVLSLKNNQLSHIDDRICYLTSLSVLDLRGNAISAYEVACLQVLLPGCRILI